MFNHNHADKAIRGLRINMPETYWDGNYVYNDKENLNQLTVIRNIKDFRIYDAIKKCEEEDYGRTFSRSHGREPFFVIRAPSSSMENDFENLAAVERFETSFESKNTDGCIIQRYIRSKGKNRQLLG